MQAASQNFIDSAMKAAVASCETNARQDACEAVLMYVDDMSSRFVCIWSVFFRRAHASFPRKVHRRQAVSNLRLVRCTCGCFGSCAVNKA